MKALCAILAVLVLAGCADRYAGGPVGNALGETRVQADFYDPAELPADMASKGPSPERITWVDGKDKASLSVIIDPATGRVEYVASDISAASPAQYRVALVDAFGDDVTAQIEAAIPGGLEALVAAIGGL